MNTTIAIEFDVVPTAPHLPLGLAVQLNGTVIWQQAAVTQTCHVVVPVDDALDNEQTLQWHISGKLPHYTLVDDLGNITQDSLLRIVNLQVDNFDITALLNTVATYTHDFNGHGSLQTSVMYQDLGCTGVGELRFRTPVYLWLLETM